MPEINRRFPRCRRTFRGLAYRAAATLKKKVGLNGKFNHRSYKRRTYALCGVEFLFSEFPQLSCPLSSFLAPKSLTSSSPWHIVGEATANPRIKGVRPMSLLPLFLTFVSLFFVSSSKFNNKFQRKADHRGLWGNP